MHGDKRKANRVWCVGGRNLKMHPDFGHLFKDFWEALYIHTVSGCKVDVKGEGSIFKYVRTKLEASYRSKDE